MSDPRQFVSCPACHLMDYHVVYEAAANLAHVLCKSCNRELLAVSMAPPDEPLRVAPI